MKPETFIIVNLTAGDGQAKKRWQIFENDGQKSGQKARSILSPKNRKSPIEYDEKRSKKSGTPTGQKVAKK